MEIREFLESLGIKSHVKQPHNEKIKASKTEYLSYLQQKQNLKWSKKREIIINRLKGNENETDNV